MKLKFLLAAAIVTLIALTSCKKDDPVAGSGGTGTTSQPKKLKKLTMTEDSVTSIYNLTYEANRLISYKKTDSSSYILFSYDAQGNVTGIEQKEAEFRNIYNFSYQDNKPVTGTFKSWMQEAGQPEELIEDDRLTYTVSNNQVTAIRLEMLQAGTESNLQLTYSGGNLVKVAADGIVPYTATFSFGSHKPAFPRISNFVLDQAGFSLQFASNNEMLSASFDFPGTSSDSNISTQYTYDSDGYVLTSDDGSSHTVFEYE